jgi:hypothetical protein
LYSIRLRDITDSGDGFLKAEPSFANSYIRLKLPSIKYVLSIDISVKIRYRNNFFVML